MSEHLPGVEQEEDRIRARPIVLLAGVSLIIAAIGVIIATVIVWRVGGAVEVGQPAAGSSAESSLFKIGMNRQTLLEAQQPEERRRVDQARRLDHYGWVDRKKNVVHIPIEEAMRIIAGGRQ